MKNAAGLMYKFCDNAPSIPRHQCGGPTVQPCVTPCSTARRCSELRSSRYVVAVSKLGSQHRSDSGVMVERWARSIRQNSRAEVEPSSGVLKRFKGRTE